MKHARENYKSAYEKKLFVYGTIATEDKDFFRYYRELMKDLYK